jgi:hypothetical protein
MVVSDAAAQVGHDRVESDHEQRLGDLRNINYLGDAKFHSASPQLLMTGFASPTRCGDG